ncbi:MAG: efflux RND transporter periplasmic adaptor subunit [Bacteroidales bacterium]|jgi:cobalt-zinc-cadmium efflux system membrane fusion protein|nr:efflux RND transporter periplasmic adaptor subunit [Bacteroidales bacterium]
MNTYKQFFILLFTIILFSSCDNATELIENEEENTIESNQFIVSKTLLETTNMSIGQVITHDFYDIVQATGTIDVPMSSKAEVSPMVAGFVSSLPFVVGDKVKKGDLLLKLQNPEFIGMQQSYLEANEELSFLQTEFERQQILSDENISSKKSFQKASSDYKLKQAQYSGLKETLKLLNVDLVKLDQGVFTSNICIFAPIEGFISSINASIGSYVAPSDVLLSLINTSHKHLEVEVFEKDALKIENGQAIRFRVPDAGNTYFDGTVFQVNKAIDMERRTLMIHGHLSNEHTNFLQGMYVEAEILTEKINAPAVPSRAVIEEEGQFYILRFKEAVGEDLIFEKIAVEVGKVTEQFTQILGAEIKLGDKIMDKGVFRLVGN